LISEIHMTLNRMFPLTLITANLSQPYAQNASTLNETMVCHTRFGHLPFQSLRLLQKHSMVKVLPIFKVVSMHRNYFRTSSCTRFVLFFLYSNILLYVIFFLSAFPASQFITSVRKSISGLAMKFTVTKMKLKFRISDLKEIAMKLQI
jgi:hypothetical protein